MTDITDVDLAYGITTVVLDDALDFQHMALDFANGCDPGNTGITFLIADTLSGGWQFHTIESVRGSYLIVMRKALADEIFARDEPGTLQEDPSDVDYAGLAAPIVNCAEYVLVTMSDDGEDIKVSQGTVIQDDDTFDGQSLDTWSRFDRLIDSVFSP